MFCPLKQLHFVYSFKKNKCIDKAKKNYWLWTDQGWQVRSHYTASRWWRHKNPDVTVHPEESTSRTEIHLRKSIYLLFIFLIIFQLSTLFTVETLDSSVMLITTICGHYTGQLVSAGNLRQFWIGRFCKSKVLLPTQPCWHMDSTYELRISCSSFLNSVTCTISVPLYYCIIMQPVPQWWRGGA